MECKLDSITVQYEVRGTGTPILMLHGFSCDRHLMMGGMEPVFAERSGWKRIYIDLPGMGATKTAEWIQSTNDMLTVVEQFVDAVLPDTRFVVAGQSYGGYLAQALLAKRPEQIAGMLMICPTAGMAKRDVPPFTVLAKDEAFLRSFDHEDAEEFTSMHVVQDRYNWERFRDEILVGIKAADQEHLERLRQQYDLEPDAGVTEQPYEKPVLIVAGRQDHAVGYRNQWEMAQRYPRASFAMLDRAGHNLHIEQKTLFDALVSEWLDRVAEEQGRT
ncbi:UNVERIFIED_CONTAM: pimeloyl-ACP methyl ester carboxylesterase [Brevibacillus sp. OAP136]